MSEPTIDLIEVVVDVTAGIPDVTVEASNDELVIDQVTSEVVVSITEAAAVELTIATEEVVVEAAAAVAVGSSVGSTFLTYVQQVDATTAYSGEAEPGTATSAALWRIQKIEELAGGITRVTWASSSTAFQHVWDDRATYTYG